MIRGVVFELPSSSDRPVLCDIFNYINVVSYTWYTIKSQEDVWLDQQGNDFFLNEKYDGKDFLKLVHHNPYMIIFLKLQAYFEKGQFCDIHTYEEFLTSDCQILLLINDCTFVEIYCKDSELSRSIYQNAIEQNYLDVEYITDHNDQRTRMDVL